jgi:hypothetical protein
MTLEQIRTAAWIFGYDIHIDGDRMIAQVFMDGVFSHVLPLK